jgi:uncharacterized protein (DUF1684 family)
MANKMNETISLLDWRRQTSELYTTLREAPEAGREVAWQHWRAIRNGMFKHHLQSPLDNDQKASFRGLSYFDFDPAYHIEGIIDQQVERETFHVKLDADADLYYTRVGQVQFEIRGELGQLSLFWIEGYGGGLFIPFKDKTNGKETYGGGRYLFDTIKGADLGTNGDEVILDFNFAYNPSCAYHSRWVCPLSPSENNLLFNIFAGEKKFQPS